MMLITKDLFLGVVFWPTKGAALTGAPSGTGAVDGQPDPAARIESFVPLGPGNHRCQCLPQALGIQPRRQIAQGVVSEGNVDGQTNSRRSACQGAHATLSRTFLFCFFGCCSCFYASTKSCALASSTALTAS